MRTQLHAALIVGCSLLAITQAVPVMVLVTGWAIDSVELVHPTKPAPPPWWAWLLDRS